MEQYSAYIKIAVIALVVTLVITALVFAHYAQIATYNGTLVVPAGNTYLGPNTPNQTAAPAVTSAPANVFTAASDTPWHDVHGRIYPYAFSAPTTLNLVTFPKDTYDIYAINCCGIDPGSNVLVGVDYKADTSESKLTYVQNWWHQFGGLKGIASIDQFTNSKGLTGFKAKYYDASGDTPNTDVFFEVPDHQNYVIHLASGSLDPAVFSKIVDSVSWGK